MRYLCFTLLLLAACRGIYREHRPDGTKVARWKTPPGVVHLRDSLYIYEHEVTNKDYWYFMHWVNLYHPSEYAQVLPDTLLWERTAQVNDSFSRNYLRHPAFQDYPVVGVSLAQAHAYCAWISLRVDEMLYLRFSKEGRKLMRQNIWDPIERGVSVPRTLRYRLPTREEWEYGAKAGLEYAKYPLGYESIYTKDSAVVDNWYSHGQMSFGQPMPARSYWKNGYGAYHMLGNVSELTSDSLIKGLNFLTNLNGTSTLPEIKFTLEPDSLNLGYTIKSYMKYDKPAAWLGFRCVCEVLP